MDWTENNVIGRRIQNTQKKKSFFFAFVLNSSSRKERAIKCEANTANGKRKKRLKTTNNQKIYITVNCVLLFLFCSVYSVYVCLFCRFFFHHLPFASLSSFHMFCLLRFGNKPHNIYSRTSMMFCSLTPKKKKKKIFSFKTYTNNFHVVTNFFAYCIWVVSKCEKEMKRKSKIKNLCVFCYYFHLFSFFFNTKMYKHKLFFFLLLSLGVIQ